MKKLHYALLVSIFIAVLGSRLYFSFITESYSSDKAYFILRQIEHIQQYSSPLYEDSLSFSGRSIVFPPLFGYLLAFTGLIFPAGFTAKFFPNLFASSFVFIAYLTGKRISGKSSTALVSAFASGFIPVFFSMTLNTISVYTLVIPVFFLLLHSFMCIKKRGMVYLYIALLAALTLLHPTAILFVLGIWLYFLMLKASGMSPEKSEIEIAIFSTFFVLLAQFLMFKKVFLFHGIRVIWQNIPAEMFSIYFSDVSFFQAFFYIGLLPAAAGAYAAYRSFSVAKRRECILLSGFAASFFLVFWLRLIEPFVGLMFLGASFSLLLAEFMRVLSGFGDRKRQSYLGWSAVLIALFATSVVPSFALAADSLENSVPENDIAAFEWIMENTPEDSVVLASPRQGNLVTAIAKRKNVIDTNFLMVPDASQRLGDVNIIYSAVSTTNAVRLLNNYDVDYIFFSEITKSEQGTEMLAYSDSECFPVVYDRKAVIYKSACVMEELK